MVNVKIGILYHLVIQSEAKNLGDTHFMHSLFFATLINSLSEAKTTLLFDTASSPS